MTETNKFGLPRTIPEQVKRKIRQNSYFGCVVCGNAVCDYEHVDPEFKDAKTHEPDKMCLLCQNHHRYLGGVQGKEKIKRSMLNPFCKTHPWHHKFENFDVDHPTIKIGDITFLNCESVLTVGDIKILQIKPPLEEGAPYRINANFFDSNHKSIVIIEDNTIASNTRTHFDVEYKALNLTIRSKIGSIDLEMDESKFGEIIIKKLDMVIHGIRIFIHQGVIHFINYSNGIIILEGGHFDTQGGILISSKGGLSLGKNGSSYIKSVSINEIDIVTRCPYPELLKMTTKKIINKIKILKNLKVSKEKYTHI